MGLSLPTTQAFRGVQPRDEVDLRPVRILPHGFPSHELSPLVAGLVALATVAGCSCNGTAPPACTPLSSGQSAEPCTSCKTVTIGGGLANAQITEASGIVASAVHADVFYVHNDSGDSARFFATDMTGADLGTFDVADASNVDWEDIARGPCTAGSCLYLGDIGGAKAKARQSLTVYRTPEPSELGKGTHTVTAEVFPMTYPDGAHDAETLLVHPVSGVVTIVTKVKSGASSIYELPMPLTPGVYATLIKTGEIVSPCASPKFTGGDVHPSATGVLLRTYDNVFFYSMKPDQSVSLALQGAPCALTAPAEPHGEAVGWLASGNGFVTVSEGVGARIGMTDCTATK